MPPVPKKEPPRFTIYRAPTDAGKQALTEKRQAVFNGWLNECREIEDTVVELLLQNLPSLKDA